MKNKFIISAGIVGMVFLGFCAVHAQSLSDIDMAAFQLQKEQYEIQSRTNPFASGITTAEDLTVDSLQLTGIVFKDEKTSYALISGYLVKPGDKIAGYKVEVIEKDRVRLRRVDDVFVLALGGGV